MMEPFVGEVSLLPYEFAPEEWMRCEGQLMPIAQHTALFSLIGNRFGGDGRTSFALPKMKPLPTEGGDKLGYFISIKGIYPRRP